MFAGERCDSLNGCCRHGRVVWGGAEAGARCQRSAPHANHRTCGTMGWVVHQSRTQRWYPERLCDTRTMNRAHQLTYTTRASLTRRRGAARQRECRAVGMTRSGRMAGQRVAPRMCERGDRTDYLAHNAKSQIRSWHQGRRLTVRRREGQARTTNTRHEARPARARTLTWTPAKST